MIKITFENITAQEFIDLLNVKEFPHLGDKIILPNGVEVTNASSKSNKFMDNDVFHFFIQTLTAVSVNILSSYLYDKFKTYRKDIKLKVSDKEVKTDVESITKALVETISNTGDTLSEDNAEKVNTSEGLVNVE